MTFRAAILGILGAMGVASLSYLNDKVAKLENLTSGHLIPIVIFGPLLIWMFLVNPLLHKAKSSWSFRPAEIALIVVLMLVACSVTDSGLSEHLAQPLCMPAYLQHLNPGWRKNHLMDYVPPSMMASNGQYDPVVVDGMLTGLGRQDKPIGLDKIPWSQWKAPLLVWLPMLILWGTTILCLCLVVHRQWSSNERLRYPIAEFAATLVDRRPNEVIAPIFRNRLFWLALGGIALIRIANGLMAWQQAEPLVPFDIDLSAISQKYDILTKISGTSRLLHPVIYAAVVAFAFFVASDVSLSLGLAQPLCVAALLILTLSGVNVSADYMTGGGTGWLRAGSYFALAMTLAYLGRRYYWGVLKQAVTFRPQDGVDNYAAWALRLCVLSLAGMTAIMVGQNAPWTLVVPTFILMVVLVLGVARVTAETGLFLVQARWEPLGVLLGAMGSFSLGPQGIIIVGLLCVMLTMDTSRALMSFFINGLKIADRLGVPPATAGKASILAYPAILAATLLMVFWANYNFGMGWNKWATQTIPGMVFDPASREVTKLKLTGQLQASTDLSPLERLTCAEPKKDFLAFAGFGAALVFLIFIMRLRFSWWPLHPVMFLVWDTGPSGMMSHSFLLGWLIKTLVTRLGGFRAYEKTKPLMIGVIAGELLAALFFMLAGAIHYLYAGTVLPEYRVFPK